MGKDATPRQLKFAAHGNPAEVATRLQEATAITTFSAGASPILTGSIDFPRVTLYRSRPPLRAMRSHTYFDGRLQEVDGNTILEGRVLTSGFRSAWFGLIVTGWVILALLMAVTSVASRSWRAVAFGLPAASLVALAAYGSVRLWNSTVRAESELLVEDIERALGDERLTIG